MSRQNDAPSAHQDAHIGTSGAHQGTLAIKEPQGDPHGLFGVRELRRGRLELP
jgi:hypothetical protein